MKLIVTTFLYLSLKLFATSNYFSLTLTTSCYIDKEKRSLVHFKKKILEGRWFNILGIVWQSTM
jgi:hypothetical protein